MSVRAILQPPKLVKEEQFRTPQNYGTCTLKVLSNPQNFILFNAVFTIQSIFTIAIKEK